MCSEPLTLFCQRKIPNGNWVFIPLKVSTLFFIVTYIYSRHAHQVSKVRVRVAVCPFYTKQKIIFDLHANKNASLPKLRDGDPKLIVIQKKNECFNGHLSHILETKQDMIQRLRNYDWLNWYNTFTLNVKIRFLLLCHYNSKMIIAPFDAVRNAMTIALFTWAQTKKWIETKMNYF